MLDRQVFWLTARSDPRATFPPRGSSPRRSGIRLEFLADHSSGPAPDSHRLPSSSHPFARAEPVETANQVVENVTTPGAPIVARASFVVETGHPGGKQA